MEKTLIVHGRQPALGRAELESLYGKDKLNLAGSKATLVDVDPCLFAFDRMGGCLKFCKVLTALDTTSWKDIEKFLAQVSPAQAQRMPEGKMRLGLSAIDFNITPKQLNASALSLKKAIKQTGRNVRVIPNVSTELSSAQVHHNNLTSPTGWELILIKDNKRTIIAQTVKVQDIEAYSKRDQQRPKRDAKVGMLPPKLAQIIINLSVGTLPEESRQSICEIPPEEPIPRTHFDQTILDPFCGTGVLVQEALLMGYGAYGSDIEQRMVEYSSQNINWLQKNYSEIKNPIALEAADATSYTWKQGFHFIACEVYLGKPLSSIPKPNILSSIIRECDEILEKFLINASSQVKPGFRMCVAVPAWRTNQGFLHLKTLDKLTNLGYNRLKFAHVYNDELIYHRPGQIVARELVVLERK